MNWDDKGVPLPERRNMIWTEHPAVLCSYVYARTFKNDLSAFGRARLFVDSGAFTAATLGVKINLADYCDWLSDHRGIIHQAAGLDVIGDWRATARNDDLMRDRLGDTITIIPTWHLGSPEHELERLCREHTYIAIGGCVPYASRPKVLTAHLIRAHRIAREHNTQLHGLGVTGNTPLTKLPWFSVDSSSWGQGHRYGKVILTDRTGKQHLCQMGHGIKSRAQAQLIRDYGGDPQWFSNDAFCNRKKAGAEQYKKDHEWVVSASARAAWTLGDITAQRHHSNLTIYLADGGYKNLELAIDAHALGSPYRK